ncbi:MAG: Peptidase [Myxococcales bacterium]|nr:Peptidase [Myxococcales bacterium]
MVAVGCPRCRGVVALHEGRPSVTSSGTVELWHRGCWEHRDVPIVVAATPVVTVIAPPRFAQRSVQRGLAAAAIATTALVGVGFAHWSQPATTTTSLANVDLGSAEDVGLPDARTTREIAPPPSTHIDSPLETRYPLAERDGERLDVTFTSLGGWIHPVTDSAELMPERHSRLFGSQRIGIERAECGAGHCGVDLDGPRGRPIVAVADGKVVRVERKELGADGRSGRYVRIQHDDSTLTAYMHMDDVAEALQVGDYVRGGQYIGTLGATAVYSAAPHLHFSLEVPQHPGLHGDTINTTYVDPAPFLVRAKIVPSPERRHAIKPAS